MSEIYNWKRFWCPRAGNIRFDYRGFLDDPEGEYGRFTNPDVVPFSAISNIPCLVLLGEAGIGKTTAIEQEYNQLQIRLSQTEDIYLWFGLGDYSSDTDLCNAIFRTGVFQTWLNGTNRLNLFLDSLDEGLLSLNILVRILKREIKNIPCDRLYFRISCRTADWRSSLEEKLKEKWGEANVGIYELAPLREVDVREAAEKKGIISDEFLDEVFNREAIPLVIKPVTLKFLLDTYYNNGQFPASKKELYEQGCLELCKEVNRDRRESGEIGEWNANQRLIVAGRIAALTLFANRAAVWTDAERGNMPNSDIAIEDLSEGKEYVKQQDFFVNESCIREVLSITGLFSSRGTHRMGFAHQTYAEFLAAWYLVQHNVPLVQVMSLLVSPEDPERKLVPQLHETAAWLASMNTEILQEIVNTDPNVLLRSDIPRDDSIQEAIVDKLLQQYEEEKLLDDSDLYKYQGYKKLLHSRLPEQLRRYIQDHEKKFGTRYVAISIATSCEIRELQEDFANLALDSSQLILLRVNAASAVCSVGDVDTRLKLKPLAVCELVEDEDDRLKGHSLNALWPDILTAEEMFRLITPPKRRNFTGSYQMFLEYKLVPKLQANDLGIALNWVEKQGLRCFGHPFEGLADAILLKAWEHFDIPGVVEAFAKISLIQWQESQGTITSTNSEKQFKLLLAKDDEKRRLLIESAIQLIGSKDNSLLFLMTFSKQFIGGKDISWMIDKIRNTECERQQQIWAKLIARKFDRQDSKEIEKIIIATQTNEVLRKEFAFYFEPIELNSDQAETMREDYQEEQQDLANCSQNRPLNPPPRERVIQLLERLESGELWAWWQLNIEMTLEPDSRRYSQELESDLTELPGWQEANAETRQRIINGAKKYIQEQAEVVTDWIGTNTADRAALAGCRAFQLLLKESPASLNSISPAIWKRWTPIIIGYPNSSSSLNQYYLELVKFAYLNAPSEAINTLLFLIDCENQESEYILITNKFNRCWDGSLKAIILEKAKDTALKPECMGCLLEILLKNDFNEAREYTKSLISLPIPSEEDLRQKSIRAAKVLVEHADSSSRVAVWSAIQGDRLFGREVIEATANAYSKGFYLDINEKQLAEFYIWLVQEYPHNEDPVYEGVHQVTVRECVSDFRDTILTQLREKGTSQACTEIQHIAEALPELTWLKIEWLQAQNNRRRKAWLPPTPSEIMQIVNNDKKRLVRDGTELLNVLIECLKELELELQGKTPAVRDIWDLVNPKSYKPLGENEFSDYVKRYLEKKLNARGIIINREVEWRPNTGGNPGERTDIHVDAVIRQPNREIFDCITAIIEVKGCWHNELDSAMETQLANRYLQNTTCQHGLYLIGWFNCNQWYENDSRQKKAPKITLDQAREQFNRQATELSLRGIQIRAFVLNAALR